MSVLKMAFHNSTGRRMVEVFDDNGVFVAAIYPGETGTNAIHIVSKFAHEFVEVPAKEVRGVALPASTMMRFKSGQ